MKNWKKIMGITTALAFATVGYSSVQKTLDDNIIYSSHDLNFHNHYLDDVSIYEAKRIKNSIRELYPELEEKGLVGMNSDFLGRANFYVLPNTQEFPETVFYQVMGNAGITVKDLSELF